MNNTPGTVLITGAGPAGMMAALELSRFGIAVRLIEKTLKPATTSRAVGVQARTLELLEQRGLAAELVSRGNPGVAVSVYGARKRIFRLSFEHIDSTYKYILLVSQAETESVLREALQKTGVKVE
jgi:2-polyprenyl-6-methoxyphenol hydroxylase-like FAD-dependent oxidoreductase